MAGKPVLYSYFRSSASWRVRIALAFKGIDYDTKPVHLVEGGGQQHSKEYQGLNPMRQVPTLVIDGVTLTQSIPIIEYLEETKPGTNLLPKDPVKRAQARKIAEIVNSGIQPIQNLSVLQKVAEITKEDKSKVEWAHHWIDRGFQGLEKELEVTAGQYCVGNEISIADICLVPQMANAKRFKVDMSKFPIIARIVEELEKNDAFIQAEPLNQPDCPEEIKKTK